MVGEQEIVAYSTDDLDAVTSLAFASENHVIKWSVVPTAVVYQQGKNNHDEH